MIAELITKSYQNLDGDHPSPASSAAADWDLCPDLVHKIQDRCERGREDPKEGH